MHATECCRDFSRKNKKCVQRIATRNALRMNGMDAGTPCNKLPSVSSTSVAELGSSFVPDSRPWTEFRDPVEIAPQVPHFSCSYARTATKAMVCLWLVLAGGSSRQHLDPEGACAGGPKRMRYSVFGSHGAPTSSCCANPHQGPSATPQLEMTHSGAASATPNRARRAPALTNR